MNRFPQWIINRRLGLALWKGFLVGLAVAMTLAGLRHARIADWQGFLHEYAGLFLVWRLALYGVIVWGWLRVCRLRQSEFESAPEARKR